MLKGTRPPFLSETISKGLSDGLLSVQVLPLHIGMAVSREWLESHRERIQALVDLVADREVAITVRDPHNLSNFLQGIRWRGAEGMVELNYHLPSAVWKRTVGNFWQCLMMAGRQ